MKHRGANTHSPEGSSELIPYSSFVKVLTINYYYSSFLLSSTSCSPRLSMIWIGRLKFVRAMEIHICIEDIDHGERRNPHANVNEGKCGR